VCVVIEVLILRVGYALGRWRDLLYMFEKVDLSLKIRDNHLYCRCYGLVRVPYFLFGASWLDCDLK
jgi:hypothetical protein